MALLHLATAVALLLGAQSAFAETTAAAQGAEIRFVPATGGGTVSLGIYDRDGKLVRVLCEEWPFNRFRVGLNGLSTTWDGKDDAGQPVPEGTYSARGFVAGHIGISGEAIHFNDWIEGTDSPRITSVAAQQLLPGGDILLMARLAGNQGALVRYSPESEARWRTVAGEPRAEPARDAKLAVSDTLAFALLDGKLRSAALTDGAELALPIPADGVLSVAARGDRLALLGADFVRFYVLPGFASQGEEKDLPVPLVSLALLDQGAVAAGADGSVWRWQAGWSRLEMPAEVKVRAVSAGRDSTFWVLEEHSDGSTSVAHYHPDEGRLADWKADGGTIISLAGTTESDYFVATLTTPDGQRTVAIRRKGQGDGWEYVFDKKSRAVRNSDGVTGRSSPREETVSPISPCVSSRTRSIRVLRANFSSGRPLRKTVRLCRHSTDCRSSGSQRRPVTSVSWLCPGRRKTAHAFSKATARAWRNIRSPTSATSLHSTRVRSR